MWFTETAWPPMVLFGTLAAIALFVWWDRRRVWLLVTGLLCAAAVAATWVIEERVVTEREVIDSRLRQLADAFVAGRTSEAEAMFSARSEDLKQLTVAVMNLVEARNLRITDVSTEIRAAGRARTHFRANGQFVVRGQQAAMHYPTRWIVTWQKEADQWRILEVQELDPITGEVRRDSAVETARNLLRGRGL